MKLGTENKNKTIIALVLVGLALLFLARWLFTGSDTNASARAPKAAGVNATAAADQSLRPPAPKKRENRRDERTLRAAWKPSLDPRLNLSMLKTSEDLAYKGNGRNIFEATPEPAVGIKIPVPVGSGRLDAAKAAPPPPPTGPPPPPPINLKFFGFANKNGGQRSIFLAQGDSVFVAREGDIIARRYRIVRINPNSVEVQDMLSNNKQTITLAAG